MFLSFKDIEIIEFSNKIKPSNNDKTNGLCKFPGVGFLNLMVFQSIH